MRDHQIEQLTAESDSPSMDVAEVFHTMGDDRDLAARQMYGYLSDGGDPRSMIDHARRLVFLKGNDSHDYKFSSAALEDYRALSPEWRNRFLAAATYQLRSEQDKTRPLIDKIRDAIA